MYNSEKTIVQTLDSVLAQTWDGKFEIIVVNDGSTDESQKIVENYSTQCKHIDIKLINQKNKGVSVARNIALKISKGNFIALIDSDDEWLPEKTKKQMAVFDSNKNIDFLATAKNGNKLLFPYLPKNGMAKITFRKLLFRNEVMPSTVIFKKKILEDVGYFQEGQNHAEDVDFFLRISENHQMYILEESLIIGGGGKRTFGVSGLSANLKKMAEGYQVNLKRVYQSSRISRFQFLVYNILYRLKYIVLLVRNAFLK